MSVWSIVIMKGQMSQACIYIQQYLLWLPGRYIWWCTATSSRLDADIPQLVTHWLTAPNRQIRRSVKMSSFDGTSTTHSGCAVSTLVYPVCTGCTVYLSSFCAHKSRNLISLYSDSLYFYSTYLCARFVIYLSSSLRNLYYKIQFARSLGLSRLPRKQLRWDIITNFYYHLLTNYLAFRN